jgi:hypothetical protein
VSKSKRRAVAPQRAPSALAARVVGEWFESVLATREVFTVGSIHSRLTETAFEQVQDAVERAHIAAHGPVSDEAEHEMIAMEAGYLLGVQVGLRLRR